MAVHSAESFVGPSLHISSILHPDWARIREGTAQASQNLEARTDTTLIKSRSGPLLASGKGCHVLSSRMNRLSLLVAKAAMCFRLE